MDEEGNPVLIFYPIISKNMVNMTMCIDEQFRFQIFRNDVPVQLTFFLLVTASRIHDYTGITHGNHIGIFLKTIKSECLYADHPAKVEQNGISVFFPVPLKFKIV